MSSVFIVIKFRKQYLNLYFKPESAGFNRNCIFMYSIFIVIYNEVSGKGRKKYCIPD